MIIFGQGVGKSRFLKSEPESESEFRTSVWVRVRISDFSLSPSPNFGLQSESESDEMAGSEKLCLYTENHVFIKVIVPPKSSVREPLQQTTEVKWWSMKIKYVKNIIKQYFLPIVQL
jgi:hypothetical protein